jgi:hypothetical protein
MDWLDTGNYWLSIAEQRSKEWKAQRIGRLTASNFGYIEQRHPTAKYKTSRFKTPEDLAKNILGKEEVLNDAMIHGVENEPYVREWYSELKNCVVKELGLVVPKWNTRIGASVDGEIESSDGIIEIKCPKTMYPKLEQKTRYYNDEYLVPDHIWYSHYCQMQGSMAILGKKWCDYIVYGKETSNIYLERIEFNARFWNDVLYPDINYFLDYVLEPMKQ